MKRLGMFLCFILIPVPSEAQTEVSGAVSGTWTLVNSPYIVTNDIYVNTPDTLIIEPGVEVRFNDFKELTVFGRLVAVGTAEDSISFRKNGINRWDWVRFSSRSSGRLAFVNITGGDSGIRCFSGPIFVSHSRIAETTQYGFYMSGDDAHLIISHSSLENSPRSFILGGGVAVISHSQLRHSQTGFGTTLEAAISGKLIINKSVLAGSDVRAALVTSGEARLELTNSVLISQPGSVEPAIDAVGEIRSSVVRGSNPLGNLDDLVVGYSNIEGGSPGVGNIDAAPDFVDAQNGDYSLTPGSPGIDGGDPSEWFADSDGSRNDMGIDGGSDILPSPPGLVLDYGPAGGGDTELLSMYNFRSAPIQIDQISFTDPVNFSSDINQPATIPANEFLEVAIEYLGVTRGPFDETASFSSPDFVASTDPVVALRGFSGTFGEVSGVWTKAESPLLVTGDLTVPIGTKLSIDPGVEVQFAGSFLFEVNGELEARGTVGDTIVFTRAEMDTTWLGLNFRMASPSTLEFIKVEHVKIPRTKRGNHAILANETDLVIRNTRIANNSNAGSGGACFVRLSDVKIIDSVFESNESDDTGGALSISQGSVTLINSRFSANAARRSGGLLTSYLGEITISGCIVDANEADRGAVANLSLSRMEVVNSTFHENKNGRQDLAAVVLNSSVLYISNSIVRGDRETETIGESSVSIRYSNVQGGAAGEGNVDADPLFVDPAGGDFSLAPGSPAIDAGDPSAIYNDLDGSRNDMGATGGSGLLLAPAVLDFGPTGKGQVKTLALHISNFRDSPFSISAITLSDEANLSIAGSPPGVISPLQRDSVTVRIVPTVIGTLEEELLLTSDDLAGATSAVVPVSALAGVWEGPVSGRWTLENAPYIIGGDIIVQAGAMLSIDAGVEIQIDTAIAGTDAEFIVEGSLFAGGEKDAPIRFTATAGPEDGGAWGGLVLRPGGGARAMPVFDNGPWSRAATEPVEAEQMLPDVQPASERERSIMSVRTDSVRLAYCEIMDATTGITAERDQIVIESSLISGNSEHGVRWNGDEVSASGVLKNSIIENNGGWGVYCFSFARTEFGTANPVIAHNVIRNNEEGGIYLYADGGSPSSWRGTVDRAFSSPSIEHNTISNNRGPAIEGFASGTWTDGIPFDHYSYAHVEPKLFGNITANNAAGIKTRSPGFGNNRRLSFSELAISNLTFWGSDGAAVTAEDSASISLVNSIIWSNSGPAASLVNGGTLAISYSDVQNGYDGTGNIDADPMFINPALGDFRLGADSPAIDAGDPASPLDADGTRADMGALPFFQPPTAPMLQSPPDGETDLATTLELRWRSLAIADSFRIQVSTSANFMSPLADTTTSDTLMTITNLPHQTQMYWRVGAVNAGGAGEFSEAWSFETVIAPPAAATLLAPSNGATGLPSPVDLEWEATAGADFYLVQIALDSLFTLSVREWAGVSSTRQSVADLQPSTLYFWRVQALNRGGPGPFSPTWQFSTSLPTGISLLSSEAPKNFALYQNYPNPFNPSTTIRFDLPRASKVKLTVFSLRGNLVATPVSERLPAGTYEVAWQPLNLASGVYIYRLTTAGFVQTRRLTVLK